MGTANTNLDPFQALSNEERAFLRAVEVLNNSFERRVYTLSANELVALLGGAKASQRRLEFLSNVLAVRDYAELEITTNYVMFGEDIDFNIQTLVAYKADDDSVEAFLVKETDSPPDYPNGLSSPDEIPPIVETLLRRKFFSTVKYISLVARLQLRCLQLLMNLSSKAHLPRRKFYSTAKLISFVARL